MILDKRQMAAYFPLAYYLAMDGKSFQQRIRTALNERGMSKAELSRSSGVPYHAIDKFLKRENASTSAENAKAIADALGITMDGDAEYDELRRLFFQLPEDRRLFVLASIRGLLTEE